MYRMTARSISLISPMRSHLAALSGASAFAAAIIAKYSGTEPFPFNGETLIYFNALRSRFEEDKKLRDNVNYTLRLTIIRRLILEGKLSDPTVTKRFMTSLAGRIEQNLNYLRVSDGTAYTRTLEAISFIDNSEDISESIVSTEIREGSQFYRLSSVDMTALIHNFRNETSADTNRADIYNYNFIPTFVFRRELIEGGESTGSASENSARNLSESVGNAATVNITQNGGNEYKYDTENLTYKTESVVQEENADILNIQNYLSTQSVKNVDNFQITDNSQIVRNTQPVQNVDNLQTVDNSQVVRNTQPVQNVDNLQTADNSQVVRNEQNIKIAQDTANVAETPVTTVSAAVTDITDISFATSESLPGSADITGINSGTVVNTTNNYDTGNSTYKTDNSVSEETTEVRNDQYIVNPASSLTIDNSQTVQNSQTIQDITISAETAETNITGSVTDVTNVSAAAESPADTVTTANITEINPETVVNAGDTNYSYDSENLTYKTDRSISEGTTDVHSEQNILNTSDTQNIDNSQTVQNSQTTQNINITAETAETIVSAPVTNVPAAVLESTTNATTNTSITAINPETVINTGDTNYSYGTENLTYKTENISSEENIDARTIPNEYNVHKTQNDVQDIRNTGNINKVSETIVSGSVTDVTNVAAADSETPTGTTNTANVTVTAPGTVVNAGDTNYSYDAGNVTHKTYYSVSEETVNVPEDQIIENTQIFQNIDNSQTVQSPQAGENITNISENTETTVSDTAEYVTNVSAAASEISPSITNVTEITPGIVVNTGDTNYSYDTENLTYKTENSTSGADIDTRNIPNEQSVRDTRNNEQNIQNFSSSAEMTVSTSVTNVTDVAVAAPESTDLSSSTAKRAENDTGTAGNPGVTDYTYVTESTTYKNETNVSEETNDVRNTQTIQNVDETQTVKSSQTIQNILNASESAETGVSASVTNVTNISAVPESTTDATYTTDVTEINTGTVVNTGDTNYSYDSENLTYKTEKSTPEETSDVHNVKIITNTVNIQDADNSQAVQNTRNTLIISDTVESDETKDSAAVTGVKEVSAAAPESSPVITNTTSITEIKPETVVNAGNSDYSYSTEHLTYKNENSVAEENTDVRNVQNIQNIDNTEMVQRQQTTQNIINTAETVETSGTTAPAPVTNVSAAASETPASTTTTASVPMTAPGTFINAGDINNYNAGNITYKTDNSVSEETANVRNEQTIENAQSVQNIDNSRTVQNYQTSQNITNAGETNETTVFAPVTDVKNVSDAGPESIVNQTNIEEINHGTVVNSGSINYSHKTENSEYKTETGTSENTVFRNISETSANAEPVRSTDGAAPGTDRTELRKVSELTDIGLLVMNSFLSGGTEYISNVKDRILHKHISLTTPLTLLSRGLSTLLQGTHSTVGLIPYAVELLTSGRELSPFERSIYESSVTQIYLENHRFAVPEAGQMLAAMSPAERTKVLTLIVNRLTELDAGRGLVQTLTAGYTPTSVRNESLSGASRPSSTAQSGNTSGNIQARENTRSGSSAGTAQSHDTMSAGDNVISARSRITAVNTFSGNTPEISRSADKVAETNTHVASYIVGTTAREGKTTEAGPASQPAGIMASTMAQSTVVPVIPEKTALPQRELYILRLLSAGRSREIPGIINAAGGDTVLSQVYRLYSGDTFVKNSETLLLNRIENALYMPETLRYADGISQSVYRSVFAQYPVSKADSVKFRRRPDNNAIPQHIMHVEPSRRNEATAPDSKTETFLQKNVIVQSPRNETVLQNNTVSNSSRNETVLHNNTISNSTRNETVLQNNAISNSSHNETVLQNNAITQTPLNGTVILSNALTQKPQNITVIPDNAMIVNMNAETDGSKEETPQYSYSETVYHTEGTAQNTQNETSRQNNPMPSQSNNTNVQQNNVTTRQTANTTVQQNHTINQNTYNITGQHNIVSESTAPDRRQDIRAAAPLITERGGIVTAAANSPAGRDRFSGSTSEFYSERIVPVYRDPLRSRDIVNSVLEKVAAYRHALNSSGDRSAPGNALPGTQGGILAVKLGSPLLINTSRPEQGGLPTARGMITPTAGSFTRVKDMKTITAADKPDLPVSTQSERPTAASAVYGERGQYTEGGDLIFNTSISEYSLPVSLMPVNSVTESVRLLPVYTLEKILLPEKPSGISSVRGRGLRRAASPAERTVTASRARMTLLNGRPLRTETRRRDLTAAPEAQGSTESSSDSMLAMMPGAPTLSYRDPMAAPGTPPAQPITAQQAPQPTQAELIRQFGNLIEGADAGLTPSFDVGTRGIGEAIAAIEQTAEKVAINTKMIEEIREKQRTIEEVTLKSTDIETISDEMIRRLRSRMRFDRSRFTEQ